MLIVTGVVGSRAGAVVLGDFGCVCDKTNKLVVVADSGGAIGSSKYGDANVWLAGERFGGDRVVERWVRHGWFACR